jgi:hypothetical protein
MSKQQDFMRFAAQCDRIAEDCEFAGPRVLLAGLADVWRQLAAAEEQTAELDQGIESPHAPMREPSSLLRFPPSGKR